MRGVPAYPEPHIEWPGDGKNGYEFKIFPTRKMALENKKRLLASGQRFASLAKDKKIERVTVTIEEGWI